MGRRAYLRRRLGPCLAARRRRCSCSPRRRARADPTLDDAARRALAVPHVDPARTAALAVDLRTGAVVFARNATLALVPASNQKLPVAYAALALLGPGYRFHTEVVGSGTPRRRRLARRPLAARLRRPDARAGRPRRARGRGRLLGDPPRRRRRDRGRVVVRRAPRRRPAGSRASTSTSRRRSRRSSSTAGWYRGRTSANPALAAGSLLRQRSRRPASRSRGAPAAACSRRPACRSRATSPSRSRTSCASWAARATTTRPRCS